MASMPLLFASSSPSSSSSSNGCCCSNSTGRIAIRLAHHHYFRRSKLPKAVAVAASPLSPPTIATLPQNRALSYKYPTGVFTTGRTNSPGKLNHVSCVTERAADSDIQVDSSPPPQPSSAVDCVGTGVDVECLATDELSTSSNSIVEEGKLSPTFKMSIFGVELWELALLISPFFFWGTAMVAMKGVLPKTGPFFVSAFRLIPAGLSLVAFAASRGRPLPSGLTAWLSISLFALVDATCFQGFLIEGLERTSAGLGSVIIDSQPLTVAVLAALLFGESIGFIGAAGLVLGVIGLLLLEVPALSFDDSNFSLWGSGEWWMLLAAQSMAVGTVMVRWVSQYSDPVMATGWAKYFVFHSI